MSLEVNAAHCDAAAQHCENGMVHSNTLADEMDGAINRLNAAGIGGDLMAVVQQVNQLAEQASSLCAQAKQAAEATASRIRALAQE